jgi:hypothetical protein
MVGVAAWPARVLADAAPDWSALAARWLAPLRAAVAALPGPGLLRSYTVRTGADATDFDRVHANCAYVYDNAVAGLALLASGDVVGAGKIADALSIAARNDRFWRDGRLRNAYAAGPMERPAKLPGWWDASRAAWLEDGYQAGSATGVIAWAMLFLTAFGDRFHAEAARAADWIAATQGGGVGFTGGFLGFEPTPARMTWMSTEQNLDCAVAFARLGRPDAGFARSFVDRMWDGAEKRFLSGLTPAGAPNRHSALDANVWPLLAGAAPETVLAWVFSRHGLPAGAPREEIDGVDFDTDRDGIWLEGTAITVLALRRAGDAAVAARFAATLAANTAPDGMIYACTTERLTTGLSTGLDPGAPDFLYFRRPHIAPTAWAVLAALGRDPFFW